LEGYFEEMSVNALIDAGFKIMALLVWVCPQEVASTLCMISDLVCPQEILSTFIKSRRKCKMKFLFL
jgi:hypothetical protein